MNNSVCFHVDPQGVADWLAFAGYRLHLPFREVNGKPMAAPARDRAIELNPVGIGARRQGQPQRKEQSRKDS
jgi:hypothetical protein